MLVFFRPRHPKKMFYQRLTLPIHELENKRQLKCTFMSIDQKEEKEVTLYPNKGSRVEQMLEEAKQVINILHSAGGEYYGVVSIPKRAGSPLVRLPISTVHFHL